MVTRRCTQRQYFLAPSSTCREVFLYCLAYAAQKTGVRIHAVIVMSNHYHIIATDVLGVLPVFVECLNKLVAKCMNHHLGRWENFWASEQASYVRLVDADAVIDKMAYVLCNPVAAGSVKHGKEWPGLRIGRPGKHRVARPAFFFREAGVMPESIALEVSLPALAGMTRRAALEAIEKAVAERERAEQERVRREGRSFAGPHAARNINPFDSPVSREPRRELSPRIATRNKWLRVEALARCVEFVRAHRLALAAWVENQRDVCFPFGTYLMRVRHGVRCADG
jgi:putative transposase